MDYLEFKITKEAFMVHGEYTTLIEEMQDMLGFSDDTIEESIINEALRSCNSSDTVLKILTYIFLEEYTPSFLDSRNHNMGREPQDSKYIPAEELENAWLNIKNRYSCLCNTPDLDDLFSEGFIKPNPKDVLWVVVLGCTGSPIFNQSWILDNRELILESLQTVREINNLLENAGHMSREDEIIEQIHMHLMECYTV
jgi:hypothetical protein